jgi:hypothetical protein
LFENLPVVKEIGRRDASVDGHTGGYDFAIEHKISPALFTSGFPFCPLSHPLFLADTTKALLYEEEDPRSSFGW